MPTGALDAGSGATAARSSAPRRRSRGNAYVEFPRALPSWARRCTVAAVSAFAAGSFEWRLLSDGEGVLPAEVMFAGAPEADRAGDPIAVPYGCLLVRGEGVVALVDAGLGAREHPLGGSGGGLIAALDTEGVRRATSGSC